MKTLRKPHLDWSREAEGGKYQPAYISTLNRQPPWPRTSGSPGSNNRNLTGCYYKKKIWKKVQPRQHRKAPTHQSFLYKTLLLHVRSVHTRLTFLTFCSVSSVSFANTSRRHPQKPPSWPLLLCARSIHRQNFSICFFFSVPTRCNNFWSARVTFASTSSANTGRRQDPTPPHNYTHTHLLIFFLSFSSPSHYTGF